MTSAFGNFLGSCDSFSEKYRDLSKDIDQLHGNYHLIESRMTYKYMDEHHPEVAKKMAEVSEKAQK